MSGLGKSKILFDARHIENIYSGLGRYSFSLLITLLKKGEFENLEIILDSKNDYSQNPLFQELNQYSTFKTTFLNAPLYKLKHHLIVSNYVNKSDADIYFYPHFDAPIFIRRKPTIFVVHDLLPLVVKNYIIKHKKLKQFFFKALIKINLYKKNTTCISVSQSTRNDILHHIAPNKRNKIKVVLEDSFDVAISNLKENDEIKEILKLKYLFYIGDRRPHKNIPLMIMIFNLLQKKYNYQGYFIIAGSEENFDIDIDRLVMNNNKIKLIGKVSDQDLLLLYKNMESLFFISEYEGFGLPIIESARQMKKIITSKTSSCEEIAPSNALLINLDDSIVLICHKVFEYLNSDIKINNINFLKKFSWAKSVKEIFQN